MSIEQQIKNQIRNRVEETLGEPKKERSEYQEFISQCMKEKGGGAEAMKVCAVEWKNKDKEQDILIVAKDCEACQTIKNFLEDGIKKGDIKLVDVESEEAALMLNNMNITDDSISVPMYIKQNKGSFKEEDIRELLWKYTT
jgi:hypothetical protein